MHFEGEFDVVGLDTLMQTLMSTGIKSVKFLVPDIGALTVRVVTCFLLSCFSCVSVGHILKPFCPQVHVFNKGLTGVWVISRGKFCDPGGSLTFFVHLEPKNYPCGLYESF